MRTEDEMKKIRIIFFLSLMMLLLTGCQGENTNHGNENKELETGFIVAEPGMYDSADTAVIVNINRRDQKIVFYNSIVKRNYTLTYDGSCNSTDKYGESISMEQLQVGEVVQIHFLKDKKKLASIQRYSEAVIYENISSFNIDEKKQEIALADKLFHFDENLLIFSNEKEIELMDLNELDKLTITTLGTQVLSIRVEEGHGYLRLKNETALVGGWIEVGNDLIYKITESMLLVVPEGKHELLLSKGSMVEKRQIEVVRDKETELDLKDFVVEEKKEYGNIIFVVSPKDAEVYIDGEFVDLESPYQAEYGIHQMLVRAEGYQTVTQYIKVGQKNATMEVNLQKQRKPSVSDNNTDSSVSSNSPVSTTGGMLTITAPEGAELYMDGNYIGVVPCSVKKTEGIHVIVLRKSGYDTRSYTIQLENGKIDQSMSFSELVKTEKDKEEDESEKENEKIEEEEKEDENQQKDNSVSENKP